MSNDDTNDLLAQRHAKLATLRDQGEAYPNDFKPDTIAAELHACYGDKSA